MLELLWNKTLLAPAFGHFWNNGFGVPIQQISKFDQFSKIAKNSKFTKLSTTAVHSLASRYPQLGPPNPGLDIYFILLFQYLRYRQREAREEVYRKQAEMEQMQERMLEEKRAVLREQERLRSELEAFQRQRNDFERMQREAFERQMNMEKMMEEKFKKQQEEIDSLIKEKKRGAVASSELSSEFTKPRNPAKGGLKSQLSEEVSLSSREPTSSSLLEDTKTLLTLGKSWLKTMKYFAFLRKN